VAIQPNSFRYGHILSIRKCNVRSLPVLQRLQTPTSRTDIWGNAGGRVVVLGRLYAWSRTITYWTGIGVSVTLILCVWQAF